MVADSYSFTLRVVCSKGEALAHNVIKPHDDDRVTIRTRAGSRVERARPAGVVHPQLEAFAAHVLDGAPLPIDIADAVDNMAYIDVAYRAAGMTPR